jgi:hypothetical protein
MCETVDWVTWLFVVLALANFCVHEAWYRSFDMRPRQPKKEIKRISNKVVASVATTAFFVAIAFSQLTQMFPLYVNVLGYIASLAAILYVGWRSKSLSAMGIVTKTFILFAACLLFCALFGTATYTQYDHENHIDLVFQDSDLLTIWRKLVITYDLGRMRNYLLRLGIPVPDTIPTIGVERNNFSCTTGSNPRPDQVFRAIFKVGLPCMTHRKVITSFYLRYVIQSNPSYKDVLLRPDQKSMNMYFAHLDIESAFMDYLNWSFWDESTSIDNLRCDPTGVSPFGLLGRADLLWKIRQTFGHEFTDGLVAYSLRATAADPLEGYDDNIGVYLGRKLKIGASVRDDGTRWPNILSILREAGFPVEQI